MFYYHRQFSEVRTPELLAKLVDVVYSLGGSNRNSQSLAMPACSNSMSLGVSSSVLVITHEAILIASPSFIADLNCSHDGEIDDTRPLGELAIAMAEGGVLDGVKNVLHDNDNDDVESVTIADDSDDDIIGTTPVMGQRYTEYRSSS
ncbi:hypothetical protein Ahy_B10g101943 [Arachis hypogaea]|uniref:Uncharacterized protein n=1 Tax=Arachis hypogaea TaxID=3818 RepID=A0A444X0U3_ARAHY|nr:hypothetical protein Ahy_B10g101943 [Arachis hypogaea]